MSTFGTDLARMVFIQNVKLDVISILKFWYVIPENSILKVDAHIEWHSNSGISKVISATHLSVFNASHTVLLSCYIRISLRTRVKA